MTTKRKRRTVEFRKELMPPAPSQLMVTAGLVPEPARGKSRIFKLISAGNVEWLKFLGVVRELIIIAAAIATAIGAWFAYKALVETGKSVENGIATAIYVNNNASTQFLIDHPELIEFFDRKARGTAITDEELMKRYGKLPQKEQNLIMLGCMIYADNAEFTFTQRRIIPECDWNGWWRYYCDLYDESPVLRQYLTQHAAWYVVDDAILKQERAHYFRPTDASCAEREF